MLNKKKQWKFDSLKSQYQSQFNKTSATYAQLLCLSHETSMLSSILGVICIQKK